MRVYVAGPYTKGDVACNVKKAIEAGNQLADAGHAPFIPHLTHFWHLLHPHDYRFWMEQDRQWVLVCDAIVRIPGESSGADEETALAKTLGVPVYHGVASFLEAHKSNG